MNSSTLPSSVATTRAFVDLDRLESNIRFLMSHSAPAATMAIIKADAYGHGAIECADVLRAAGVTFFAVATLGEAIALRNHRVKERILVLAAPLPDQLEWYAEFDIEIALANTRLLNYILDHPSKFKHLKYHLKVDTGMGRQGMTPVEFSNAVPLLRDAGFKITGAWTHFANADIPGDPLTERQSTIFFDLIEKTELLSSDVHIMNSASLLAGAGVVAFGDYVRAGISLYGLAGTISDFSDDLVPLMTLTSKVLQVKSAAAGTGASYGQRWIADRPTRIATVGAGYADGYPRVISSDATVGIGGTLFPIIGTVCMDMLMVDIGTTAQINEGDEVILFGSGGPSISDVAAWAKTIPYEISCRVSKRVPRIYIRNGQIQPPEQL